jgi:hypothetical protein
MSRLVPNERSFIAWSPTRPADFNAPTSTEIGNAIDLTCECISLTATAQGNAVPIPELCSLWEKSVPGTASAQFSADFYRDDEEQLGTEQAPQGGDIAYRLLQLGADGVFYVSRFLARDTAGDLPGSTIPAAGDPVEVWPVTITSTADGPLSSSTPLSFSITAAVPERPVYRAIVAA